MPAIGLAAGTSTIEQRASACMQKFHNQIHPLCEGSRGLHYFDEDKSNEELTRMTTVMANFVGTCSASQWDTDYHPRAPVTMARGGILNNIANQERTVMMSEHGITVQMSLAFGSTSQQMSPSAMNPSNEKTLSSVICTPKTRRKQVLASQAANGDTNQEPRYYKTKLCKYTATAGCPRGARFEATSSHMIACDVNALSTAHANRQTEWYRCWFAHGQDELRTKDPPDNNKHVVC